MGDWYEIKELAGVYYIDYQNDNTGWNNIAIQLTDSQAIEVEAFVEKQLEDKHEFLKAFVGSMKK